MDERLQASDEAPPVMSCRRLDDEWTQELRHQESDEWRRYAAGLGLFPERRPSARQTSHPLAA